MIARAMRRVSRRLHEGGDDAGYGMLLVIGMMMVMSILVATMYATSSSSLASSYHHQRFDAALASAETGIDEMLSREQRAYVYFGISDYPWPNAGTTMDASPSCNANANSYKVPTADIPWPSASAERVWAKQQIAQLVANNPSCLQHTSQGDFVVFAPSNLQTVYAEGWAPSYGASNAVTRLIKAEYLFAPYAPNDAVLTGCNLELDASTTITSVPSADPKLAAVHSNCKVSVPQGNPSVTGPVSSSGDSGGASSKKFSDNSNGAVSTTATEDVPVISAAEVYTEQEPNYASNWYDMCPDGTVRSGSSSGPCTGTVLTTLSAGSSQYRGFQYEGTASDGSATWNLKSGALDGVYYFQAGNITMGTGLGNPSSNAVTIIAADKTEGQCLPVGGTISWDHDDIASPYITNLFMLADHNLITGSNFHAGSASGSTVTAGMFVAGDQMDMSTSSQGAYGAVVAGDQCASVSTDPYYVAVNKIDNPSIYYDPNSQAPFTDIIDTTLWLEYTG